MALTTGNNKFGIQKWTVNPTAGLGTHQTIAAAIASASSGDTIMIMPGTYTENVTVSIQLSFIGSEGLIYSNVGTAPISTSVINGSITIDTGIKVSFFGLQLKTNGATGLICTNSPSITITECVLQCANTLYSSGGGLLVVMNSYGYFSGTGLLFAATGGRIFVVDSDMSLNGPLGAANTATSMSKVRLENSCFGNPVSISPSLGAGCIIKNCLFQTITNSSITVDGSNVGHVIDGCYIDSGAASAVTVTTSATTVMFTRSTVVSSNTNAITGTGTIAYGSITFAGTSSTVNTSTATTIAWPVLQGGTGLATATTAYAPIVAGTTATGAFQAASTGLSTANSVFISNGASALPSFVTLSSLGAFTSLVGTQVFVATGTYIPTTGMKFCIVEAVGGGGGGAGCPLTGATAVAAGGGGGGGGYARKVFTAAAIGTSQTVTIGGGGAGGTGNAAGSSGGDTTLGILLTGSGAAGGGNAGASIITSVGGGVGGVSSSGNLNGTGGSGGSSFGHYLATGSAISSGCGGISIFGTGGTSQAGTGAVSNNGNAGAGYGGGGGGAANTESQSAKNGGAGSGGIIVVTEFC